MKSRNWVRLFLTTLILGAIVTSIVGFALKWTNYKELFISFEIVEILSTLFWFVGVGFIFSIISQMGFFAYLTVHRFGLGLFKSMWNLVQIVLIAFVFFDLVYFRYTFYAEGNETVLSYIIVPFVMLVISVIVAYVKRNQTNKNAFIPAIFFMFVITTIEWVPAIRTNENDWLFLMLIPLIVCNAYQLLILHKINKQS